MLDRLIINSKFMKGIIKIIAENAIKKGIGYDTEIDLKTFDLSVNDDGTVRINLDISGKMRQEDFKKLLLNNIR